MEISVTNYNLLLKRVEYIQALDSFESHKHTQNTQPEQIIIQPCDFATDDQIIQLFEILQKDKINYTELNTIHFITMMSFAELFMVDILKIYIASQYFTKSVNTATKSILWIVEHKHTLTQESFSNYIEIAATRFGTYQSNLKYSLMTDNWLANFVTLRAHLRKTYTDKIEKERWNFEKVCTICAKSITFDGRGIHHDSLIRKPQQWQCNTCNPTFKIKWLPIQRFDVM